MTSAYVWMRHPGLLPDNEPVEQPRGAFDAVYGPQGWVETDPPAVDAPAVLGVPPAEIPGPVEEPAEAAPSRRPARSVPRAKE
jgi:hypothetical protein